jgi:hypothetical protein
VVLTVNAGQASEKSSAWLQRRRPMPTFRRQIDAAALLV